MNHTYLTDSELVEARRAATFVSSALSGVWLRRCCSLCLRTRPMPEKFFVCAHCLTDGETKETLRPDSAMVYLPGLQRERERMGYTKKRLAEISGVTRTTIYNIEHGRWERARLSSAKALAGALGVDVSVLEIGERRVA